MSKAASCKSLKVFSSPLFKSFLRQAVNWRVSSLAVLGSWLIWKLSAWLQAGLELSWQTSSASSMNVVSWWSFWFASYKGVLNPPALAAPDMAAWSLDCIGCKGILPLQVGQNFHIQIRRGWQYRNDAVHLVIVKVPDRVNQLVVNRCAGYTAISFCRSAS